MRHVRPPKPQCPGLVVMGKLELELELDLDLERPSPDAKAPAGMLGEARDRPAVASGGVCACIFCGSSCLLRTGALERKYEGIQSRSCTSRIERHHVGGLSWPDDAQRRGVFPLEPLTGSQGPLIGGPTLSRPFPPALNTLSRQRLTSINYFGLRPEHGRSHHHHQSLSRHPAGRFDEERALLVAASTAALIAPPAQNTVESRFDAAGFAVRHCQWAASAPCPPLVNWRWVASK